MNRRDRSTGTATAAWNRPQDCGPFDIVGDVHGCLDELMELFGELGYRVDPFEPDGEALFGARHPEGRRLVFVGDIADKGPRNLDALRLVMGLCARDGALCVLGNHDAKLARWLAGRAIQMTGGIEATAAELDRTSMAFRERLAAFLAGLPAYLRLCRGTLVVAHAGLKAEMQGRDPEHIKHFALYGDTTGEVDEFGLPVRRNWALDYDGEAAVVYGHTPMRQAEWVHNTLCIDTGCAYGNRLTALRWPEREIVSVPALRPYAPLRRPLGSAAE